MKTRSRLFVPADSEPKLEKSLASRKSSMRLRHSRTRARSA